MKWFPVQEELWRRSLHTGPKLICKGQAVCWKEGKKVIITVVCQESYFYKQTLTLKVWCPSSALPVMCKRQVLKKKITCHLPLITNRGQLSIIGFPVRKSMGGWGPQSYSILQRQGMPVSGFCPLLATGSSLSTGDLCLGQDACGGLWRGRGWSWTGVGNLREATAEDGEEEGGRERGWGGWEGEEELEHMQIKGLSREPMEVDFLCGDSKGEFGGLQTWRTCLS